MKGFLKRGVVAVFAIVLLVFLPSVNMGSDGNAELIYNVFVGAKSKYQGMIEVWNIDTFEAGNVSKTSMLSVAGKRFQELNKGLFVMVRNVTPNECKYLLESGQKPDIFSCSYGVANLIKEHVQPIDDNAINIYQNFKTAGIFKNELFAVPWCAGFYSLISTESNLKKAGVNDFENFNLFNECLNLGYDKTNKNKTKTIYSLDFGMGDYLVPAKALYSYNENKELSISEKSINKTSVSGSPYSAYCRFVAGESVCLLGSHKDVLRMKNREVSARVQDVVYLPLTNFTDMIQFVFLTKGESEAKNNYKQKFIELLISDWFQEYVANTQMLSVKNVQKTGVMQDIIHENIGIYADFNIFISFEEIEKLRKI